MKTFEEKSNNEEWGAWKFVSDMLDKPDSIGIYPTSECYEKIHDFVIEQKCKEIMLFKEELQKRANTTPPNLLLNEIVNYAYDRVKEIK
jgi:hypothetical protein